MSGHAGCVALHHPKPRSSSPGADHAAIAAPVDDSTAPLGRKVQPRVAGSGQICARIKCLKTVGYQRLYPHQLFNSLLLHQANSLKFRLPVWVGSTASFQAVAGRPPKASRSLGPIPFLNSRPQTRSLWLRNFFSRRRPMPRHRDRVRNRTENSSIPASARQADNSIPSRLSGRKPTERPLTFTYSVPCAGGAVLGRSVNPSP